MCCAGALRARSRCYSLQIPLGAVDNTTSAFLHARLVLVLLILQLLRGGGREHAEGGDGITAWRFRLSPRTPISAARCCNRSSLCTSRCAVNCVSFRTGSSTQRVTCRAVAMATADPLDEAFSFQITMQSDVIFKT